jgi:hypothetical protein
MKKETITRKELYDLIWSEPISIIAKRYNISDVGLRKICIRKNIPVPDRGHWTKVRFGYKVRKKKLPKYTDEDKIELSIAFADNSGTPSPRAQLNALEKEIQNDPDLLTLVPDRLSDPDPLIKQAKISLADKKSHDRIFDGVVKTNPGEIKIRVAPKNIRRALRIMNAFIKLAKARGHSIKFNYDGTCIRIEEVEIPISLMERFKIVKSTDRWSSRTLVPSGQLCIRIGSYSQKEIKDGRRSLEELLPRIMAKLELDAKQTMEDRKIQAERNRIQEEKLRKIKAEQNRIENEILKFKGLINNANLWQYSMIIRGHVKAVKENAISNQSLTPEVEKWILWAIKKADWLDPIIEETDPLFSDLIIDNNPLVMKREKKPFKI